MTDAESFVWIVLFSSIGVAYVIYGLGRRKRNATIAGIGLCVVPHVIPFAWLLLVIGVVLIALPMVYRY